MRFTDTLNLDEMPTFTKSEVAAHQLERALRLFLAETDCVCAITLAGVSEEILENCWRNQTKNILLARS